MATQSGAEVLGGTAYTGARLGAKSGYGLYKDEGGTGVGQVPLYFDTTTGAIRRVNDDVDIPGQVVMLDSSNAGTPRTSALRVAGSTTPEIRYNAATSRWELSTDGSTYYPIAFVNDP